MDLRLSIFNGCVSFKIRPSYRVYISQLIRFARVRSHVDDLKVLNRCLPAKLLEKAYRYYKLRRAFSKFYRRHKFNVGLTSLYIRIYRNKNFMAT